MRIGGSIFGNLGGRMMEQRNFLKQGWMFTLISGIGWLMDFGIYMILSSIMDFQVMYANMLSSLPAITFVFTFATHRIFEKSRGRFPLSWKYAIYLLYQGVLVGAVSILAEILYQILGERQLMAGFFSGYLNMLVKCLITPITLLCNFFFMKILLERL